MEKTQSFKSRKRITILRRFVTILVPTTFTYFFHIIFIIIFKMTSTALWCMDAANVQSTRCYILKTS